MTINVVSKTEAVDIPLYQNNNGNPPYNNNPYSNTTANSARLYQLNATTNTVANKTGLGIVLKVMAGDNVNIFGKSYHKRPSGGGAFFPAECPIINLPRRCVRWLPSQSSVHSTFIGDVSAQGSVCWPPDSPLN